MEESSLDVKMNQNIQNRVSIICDACGHEGNRFSFPKLLNIKNWGGVWGGNPHPPQFLCKYNRQGNTNFRHFFRKISYLNEFC